MPAARQRGPFVLPTSSFRADPKDTMSLAGLLSVIAADPQLQRALSQGDTDTDLVAPPALRPFLAASIASPPVASPGVGSPGAAGQPRFVLAVTATAREAEDLTSALGSLLPEGSVAYFPAWETLPHERLSPRSDTSGRRLAVLRRLAHPDAGRARSGALTVLVTPVRSLLQPMVSGLGDLEPVGAARRRGGQLRRGHRAPGRDRLRAHRPGRAPRRDRGPRRHPRRVPAHRGAPAPGRVLGGHGRGDPLFPRGRPAQPARRGGGAMGAAVPGTAAHPGGAGAGQATRGGSSRAGRNSRQTGRRHRGRGHGGVRAGPGRPDGTAARPRAPGRTRAGLRPRADPGPGRRPGPHQPGVPGGLLGDRRGGRPGSRSTWARPRSSRCPRSGRPPSTWASAGGR